MQMNSQPPEPAELTPECSTSGVGDRDPVEVFAFPATSIQRRLLFLEQLGSERYIYNTPFVYQLSGPLDPLALETALRRIIERHEILRTTFTMRDGAVLQLVKSEMPFFLPVIDVPSSGSPDGVLSESILQEVSRPFDLSAGPLFRARLFRVNPFEHILALTSHHTVLDAWADRLLVMEIKAFYEEVILNQPHLLSELPIQFGDYAVWMEDRMQDQHLESQLTFWRKELAGVPALNLPLDRPRPRLQTYRGSTLSFSIPGEVTHTLRMIGRTEKATPFMTFVAAFQVLMHRYCGQDDVPVGITVSGRNRSEVEPLLGCFINTLVLRGRISEDLSFREHLCRVRDRALGVYAHQEVPFERLVEELCEWEPSKNPLFQVLFNHVPRDGEERIGEAVLTRRPVDMGVSRFDLTLSLPVDDLSEVLIGSVEYNSDLFQTETVEQFVNSFLELLAGICRAPDSPVSRLPLLDHAQATAIVHTRAGTTVESLPEGSFLSWFADSVQTNPDAVAVEDERGNCWSYGELWAESMRVVTGLARRGIRAGELVAVHLERGAPMLAVLLGILRSRAAYLPLDPLFPEERIRRMLANSGAALVVVGDPSHSFGLDIPEISATSLLANTSSHCFLKEDDFPRSSDLAYVIYTSGSTGEPKGIEVEHSSLRNFLGSMMAEPGLAAHDRLFAVTTLSFDISALELFLPLCVGARVIIPSSSTALDGHRLHRHLRESGATVMQATPATWRMLLDAGWAGYLEKILCGGEALTAELAKELGACGREIWNLYGPTETTIWSTLDRVTGDEAITVGRPIMNTRVYVLDSSQNLVPDRVAGEVWIAGAGLARGYRGLAELSAERFLPDPYVPGERMYRTGDLGRWRRDGRLEHLGRIDFQVKIRGFRIELAEVEAHLEALDEIRQAVAMAVGEDEDRRLVAYVQFEEGRQSPSGRLRERLLDSLPQYMVPDMYLRVDAFPLTPNGKVDRQALPHPAKFQNWYERGYEAPQGDLEVAIAQIWKDLLKVEEVGRDVSFFELGGHSLLATRLVSRIRESVGVEIPLRTLFLAPTVSHLAREILDCRLGPDGGDLHSEQPLLPRIYPAPEERFQPFPLNDIQQAYWIGRGESLELGGVSTHLYQEIDCEELDLDRLELSIRRLIMRHDMLRTSILPDGTQQTLQEAPPFRIESLDLRGLDAESLNAELSVLRQHMATKVLPVDEPPLLEVRATLLDGNRTRLHLHIDFLMLDARSLDIISKELSLLYANFATDLPPLDLSFRDYVLAGQAFQDSPPYERAKEYWLERLATLPPGPQLPLAKDPRHLAMVRTTRKSALLASSQWKAFKDRASSLGVTPTALLLTVFSEILATWSRTPHFTLNLTLFNRLSVHPQIKDVVGDFTALTMLEVCPGERDTLESQARHLQERLWADLDHRHFSGVRVLRELFRTARGVPGAIMPVVFTSLLPDEPSDARPAPWSWLGEVTFEISQTPQVWLDHIVREEAGKLVIIWDLVEGLFEDNIIEEMFAAYIALLHRVCSKPGVVNETRYDRVRGMIPLPRVDQRDDASSFDLAIPNSLLHDLFLDQVKERPLHPAVLTSNRTITYDELSHLANMVGHWLRQRGASPNTLIAVVMEKGWEQVVAVLGTILSGAAYLPIDATLPQERVHFLLKDGKVSLALTQSRHDRSFEWPSGIQRLSIDELAETGLPETVLVSVQGPDDLAYVIHTSGSTGQPKGVMIDHRGAVNTILDVNQRFNVGPHDRILALSSLSFDLSVYDIFGLLAAGGTIVIPDAHSERDPPHWAEMVERHRVTIWNTVPALMQMLTEYERPGWEALLSSLRLVLLSGDWIPVSLPEKISRLSEGAEVVSLGGATEASIWSILHPIKEVSTLWTSIPYGRAMANQSFQVLDNVLAPRPIWVPGELYIGGLGLAKGYWGDERKTSERFITHPETGQRLYRTGDMGRYLPSGEIEFLGREDFQVKIRGHRIELGEVEAVLSKHPFVETAVVTVSGETTGPRRLLGYVVLNSDGADHLQRMDAAETERGSLPPRSPVGLAPDLPQGGLLQSDLTEFLAQKLPDYMIPRHILVLDSLPLTANGKIDRKALPEVQDTDPGSLNSLNADEHALTQIWQDVLGVSVVGRSDNFFDLGGDSVAAVRIISRANRTGFGLTVRDLFEYSTIAELARRKGVTVAAGGNHEAGPAHEGAETGFEQPSDFGLTPEELAAIANAIRENSQNE